MFAHHHVLNKVEKLLEDFMKERKGIRTEYRKKITTDDVLILRQLMNTQSEVEDIDVNLFLQYLTEQGYFNILEDGMNYAYIRIPNNRIEAEIENTITSYRFYKYKFKKKFNFFQEFAENVKALYECAHKYNRLITCLENVYMENERLFPYSEYAFQRDIIVSEKVHPERSAGRQRDRLDIILLKSKEKAIILGSTFNRGTAIYCEGVL